MYWGYLDRFRMVWGECACAWGAETLFERGPKDINEWGSVGVQ